MMKFTVGLVAAAAASLAGGANAQTASDAAAPPVAVAAPTAASAGAGPVIGFTARSGGGFVASTPGKAAFGMLGALAAISAGKEMVATNGIQDPAAAIAHDVADALAQRKTGRLATAPVVVQHDKVPDFVSQAAGARYVVDAQTTAWAMEYFSTDWGHYHVDYAARFKVIDVASQKVVAQDTCKWSSNKADPADRPGRGELTDNGAAGLKARLGAAEKACAAQFTARVAAL